MVNYQKNIILFGIKSDKKETVYNKIFLKTKVEFPGDEVTYFYDKEIPKMDSNHACFAVISLDSGLSSSVSVFSI